MVSSQLVKSVAQTRISISLWNFRNRESRLSVDRNVKSVILSLHPITCPLPTSPIPGDGWERLQFSFDCFLLGRKDADSRRLEQIGRLDLVNMFILIYSTVVKAI